MVHALREIWRVLAPGGTLIDLRPLSARWPVEVVVNHQATVAGLVDDSPGAPLDTAANESLAQAAREGLFTREQENSFKYLWYWDTPDEMKAYLEENWAPDAILPDEVLAEASAV
ncbi:MAG: hypothetical protein AAB217_09400, partial [Chloroflexota bacterium]